jgi:uncharacterized Zn finger protein (UPF0148 family)
MNPTTTCPKCDANLYDGKWYCVVCPICKFDLEKDEEEKECQLISQK